MYIYIYLNVYLYVYIYIYISECVSVCIYIYICVYTYIHVNIISGCAEGLLEEGNNSSPTPAFRTAGASREAVQTLRGRESIRFG